MAAATRSSPSSGSHHQTMAWRRENSNLHAIGSLATSFQAAQPQVTTQSGTAYIRSMSQEQRTITACTQKGRGATEIPAEAPERGRRHRPGRPLCRGGMKETLSPVRGLAVGFGSARLGLSFRRRRRDAFQTFFASDRSRAHMETTFLRS